MFVGCCFFSFTLVQTWQTHTHTHTPLELHIKYIFMSLCVCVCVCVCFRLVFFLVWCWRTELNWANLICVFSPLSEEWRYQGNRRCSAPTPGSPWQHRSRPFPWFPSTSTRAQYIDCHNQPHSPSPSSWQLGYQVKYSLLAVTI